MFFLRSSVLGVPVIPTNTMKKTRSKKHETTQDTPQNAQMWLIFFVGLSVLPSSYIRSRHGAGFIPASMYCVVLETATFSNINLWLGGEFGAT